MGTPRFTFSRRTAAPTPASGGDKRTASRSEFNVAAHGLRGIASMMVFWAHLLGGTAEHIYQHDSQYVSLVAPPWHFGAWGVQLFFVISGFVILPSIARYSASEFALRRFFRLYPLFFAFSLIFVVLNMLTNAYPATNDPLAVVSGLLFTNLFTHTEQLTPNAWSLTYEVMFYTLACALYTVAVVRRNWIATAVVIALSLAFLIRYPISVFFVFGILVRLGHDRSLFLPVPVARALEAVMIVLCIYLTSIRHFDYSQADMADPLAFQIMAATAIYFYLAVSPKSLTNLALGNRVFAYLGTVSYSLYLLHPYTYFVMRETFDRFGLFAPSWGWSMAAFFAVTTPLTLLLTHLVHKWLEVGPYNWYFHQRVYRQPKEQLQSN